MYRYAYLVGNGIIAIFWLVFFFLRKDLRKQQLFLSLLLAPFAPLTQFLLFYHDYWRPEYIFSITIADVRLGLEDAIFGFLTSGVAGVIYETVFRKRHTYGKKRTKALFLIISFSLFLTLIFTFVGLNSIWANSLTLAFVNLVMISIDNDLVKDAIFSAIFIVLLIILLYLIWLHTYPGIIAKFWVTEGLSGIALWGIPIEELVWFGVSGMTAGIIYEFWLNVEKYPKKKRSG